MRQVISQTKFLFSTHSIIRVALGAVLLFLCTQVIVPLKPVPITMQTAGVLIIALCYSKREAIYSVLTYIIAGAIGVPVFSNFGSGTAAISGPTGGYIIGFILCVYVITYLREKFGDDNVLQMTIYGVIGSAVNLASGICYLSTFVGFEKAIEVGLLPFIIPGLAKALFAAASVRLINKKLSEKRFDT